MGIKKKKKIYKLKYYIISGEKNFFNLSSKWRENDLNIVYVVFFVK